MSTDVSLINPKLTVTDNNSTVTITDNSGETTVLISNIKAPDLVISSPTVVAGDNLTTYGFIIPQTGQGTVISSTNVTGSNSPFIITMPTLSGVDDDVFQINSQGVVVLGSTVSGSTAPAPTPGGFYYHNGVFYFGTI